LILPYKNGYLSTVCCDIAIGKILGHSQASTTSRYAHLAENPVAQAAAETAEGLAQELNLGMSKIKQLHTNSS
ncbi:hypothetical protein, partial [Bilophila wadsworthia]|uniref:hypothetical protein n=1 Tax=Bilophila wadsworthia TaxID=35833 RepID=UPI001EDAD277